MQADEEEPVRAAATAPEAAVEARIDQLPDPDTTIKPLMNSALRVWTRRSHREGVIKAQARQSTDIYASTHHLPRATSRPLHFLSSSPASASDPRGRADSA